MKTPVFIATILLATLGASWAAPPSKNHNPNYKNVRAQQQQGIAQRADRMQRMQRSNQRATTFALNVRENRNQFKSYRHRNKGH